ncbi:MAG: NAD-dependent DNA ligase LigA [Lachnospiraceae bacterium]|nr:NAD-dependent DNA ligase LigA [Lachnospiraceae bacterium]
MDEQRRMRELIDLLTRASRAYYAEDTEIMSNYEYDALYDELVALEEKTGVVMSDSPTVRVGYESVDELPKERHASPMLSLDKTKSREDLQAWLGDQEGLLSWKLDGLTIVLTYEGGKLVKAVTRGNGEIGEVITGNARAFRNIPMTIPFDGTLVLRGEAVIRYSDFDKINAQLEEEAAEEGRTGDVRYKNPRNLCSGSVRQLDSAVTAKRNVRFYAFALVSAAPASGQDDGPDFANSREKQFEFLQEQGFETVEYHRVSAATIQERIEYYEKKIQHYDIPSDGLVLLFDDIAYGEALGRTAKFPRNSIAFKWADEISETVLREVEWSASRTGLINPVAIFDPVELEGTTVQRASVHNVSIVRALKLGIGDRITVYKANMIIPQIAENLTQSDSLVIPDTCPVCGGPTQIRSDNDSQVLVCLNPDCAAKKLKSFALFTSRNAMNIEGLSEMTLEKLIARGWLKEPADIYHLDAHHDEFVEMEGFGEKSYAKLMEGIELSRTRSWARILYSLGIPGIGAATARVLIRHFGNTDAIGAASEEELAAVEGVGPVLAGAIRSWFENASNRAMLDDLMKELTPPVPAQPEGTGAAGAGAAGEDGSPADAAGSADGRSAAGSAIAGKTFVITGAVHHFANREALKEFIEDRGGKAAGSVSSKTDYLINNDVTSTSGKNKKAQELGIPILSEEAFLELAGAEHAD